MTRAGSFTMAKHQLAWRDVLPNGRGKRLDPSRPPLPKLSPEERRRMRREDMKANGSDAHYRCILEIVARLKGNRIVVSRSEMVTIAERYGMQPLMVAARLRRVGRRGASPPGAESRTPKPYTFNWSNRGPLIDAVHEHFQLA